MRLKFHIAALCLLCAMPAAAQSELFKKFSQHENVKSIYISKDMFRLISASSVQGLDLGCLNGKLESLQVLSTNDERIREDIKNGFTEMANGNDDYDHSTMERKGAGSDTTWFLFSRPKQDGSHSFIMLMLDEKSATYMEMLGKFTLDDVQNFVKK